MVCPAWDMSTVLHRESPLVINFQIKDTIPPLILQLIMFNIWVQIIKFVFVSTEQ